eukprot:scaffold4950_cov38-Prasinocladus_malaysianus.AAC.1
MEIPNRQIKGKGLMTTYLLKWGNWEKATEKLSTTENTVAALPVADTTHQDDRAPLIVPSPLNESNRRFRPYQDMFSSSTSPSTTYAVFNMEQIPLLNVPSAE